MKKGTKTKNSFFLNGLTNRAVILCFNDKFAQQFLKFPNYSAVTEKKSGDFIKKISKIA